MIAYITEKGPGYTFGHCPNPAYTIGLVEEGFSGYIVLSIPEYEGNLNLNETTAWIAENFAGKPIVVNVFEGGSDKLPYPNVMMNITELEQIMAVANVTGIRFTEVESWFMDRDQPAPINWVRCWFDYALQHNLTIYWSDWKLGTDVDFRTRPVLAGYEDKIVFLSQTNDEYDHPIFGYLLARQYTHWGASVQSWWVDPITGADRDDLPIETVLEYARLARNMGAEVIQIEPYWYFFENGEPTENMTKLWSVI